MTCATCNGNRSYRIGDRTVRCPECTPKRDCDLMRVLYADGMPVEEIAWKFDRSCAYVRCVVERQWPRAKSTARLLETIGTKPASEADIAARLGKEPKQAQRYLRLLAGRGLVRRVALTQDGGLWRAA